MHQAFVANPLSRAKIRFLASSLRSSFGLSNQFRFPIIEFVENVLPQAIDGYAFLVEPVTLMGPCHGKACPEKNVIRIREDVYLRAYDGEGRDRFTIAHELGHFLLHQPSAVVMARLGKGETIVPYQDPEWQANVFAGEILIPQNLIQGMTSVQISRECGVSLQAARVQLDVLSRKKERGC